MDSPARPELMHVLEPLLTSLIMEVRLPTEFRFIVQGKPLIATLVRIHSPCGSTYRSNEVPSRNLPQSYWHRSASIPCQPSPQNSPGAPASARSLRPCDERRQRGSMQLPLLSS